VKKLKKFFLKNTYHIILHHINIIQNMFHLVKQLYLQQSQYNPQLDGDCKKCGLYGHILRYCPLLSKKNTNEMIDHMKYLHYKTLLNFRFNDEFCEDKDNEGYIKTNIKIRKKILKLEKKYGKLENNFDKYEDLDDKNELNALLNKMKAAEKELEKYMSSSSDDDL
jgi:hypothetical protein